MLRLENGGIPMRQAGRKPAVVALLAPWEINQHHPRRLRHCHRTEKALDQLQAQIGPGHQPTCRDDVSAIYDQPIDVEFGLRESVADSIGLGTVHCNCPDGQRSEEHTSELPSRMRTPYDV